MKSSPLVQLLESFFVFFMFVIGAVLLIVGMEPHRLWKLSEWIESSANHCIWLGCGFIAVAIGLTFALVKLYSSRLLELKLHRKRGKVELEPTALKNTVLQFWRTQTPFPIPSQVNVTKAGLISITAKAPFTAFTASLEEEQKRSLVAFEKDLIETLQRQLGYQEPVVLRWILPSTDRVHERDGATS